MWDCIRFGTYPSDIIFNDHSANQLLVQGMFTLTTYKFTSLIFLALLEAKESLPVPFNADFEIPKYGRRKVSMGRHCWKYKGAAQENWFIRERLAESVYSWVRFNGLATDITYEMIYVDGLLVFE